MMDAMAMANATARQRRRLSPFELRAREVEMLTG